MAAKPMWMVRADEGGRLFEGFKTASIVAIGWSEMGDMGALKTRDDLVRAILVHYERMDADTQRLVPLRKVYRPG